MDNILKLLLGVLSFAGLLAMLVPANLAVKPPAPAVAVAPTAEVPPQITDQEPPPEEEMIDDEAEDDPFSNGQPIIDGNPINDSGQPVMNMPNSDLPQQAPPSYDPAAYSMPGMTNYAPQPVYNVPGPAEAYAPQVPVQ
jgi:hypothetical protein